MALHKAEVAAKSCWHCCRRRCSSNRNTLWVPVRMHISLSLLYSDDEWENERSSNATDKKMNIFLSLFPFEIVRLWIEGLVNGWKQLQLQCARCAEHRNSDSETKIIICSHCLGWQQQSLQKLHSRAYHAIWIWVSLFRIAFREVQCVKVKSIVLL